MNLSYGLLPEPLFWMAHAVFAVVIGRAVYTAPWKRLGDNQQRHVFMGSAVFLLLIWSMKAGIDPGLDFHLLGGTLLMLMFGWQLALISVALVLGGVTLNGVGDWSSFSVNALLMGAVPILLSYGIYRFAVRYLPHHFFVYVIVNAYFCAGLAMAATVFTASLLFLCCSSYTFDKLAGSYLTFAPFMMFAEGFFTGMLAASMALLRPEWIWTFDDRRYLAGK